MRIIIKKSFPDSFKIYYEVSLIKDVSYESILYPDKDLVNVASMLNISYVPYSDKNITLTIKTTEDLLILRNAGLFASALRSNSNESKIFFEIVSIEDLRDKVQETFENFIKNELSAFVKILLNKKTTTEVIDVDAVDVNYFPILKRILSQKIELIVNNRLYELVIKPKKKFSDAEQIYSKIIVERENMKSTVIYDFVKSLSEFYITTVRENVLLIKKFPVDIKYKYLYLGNSERYKTILDIPSEMEVNYIDISSLNLLYKAYPVIYFSKEGNFVGILLRKTPDGARICHFHSMNTFDCIGEIRYPVFHPEAIKLFLQEYLISMQVINLTNLAMHNISENTLFHESREITTLSEIIEIVKEKIVKKALVEMAKGEPKTELKEKEDKVWRI